MKTPLKRLWCRPIFNIAIDFDGTVVTSAWPAIGRFKLGARWVLRRLRNRHVLILSTCREGETLDQALRHMSRHGVGFHFVNENSFERIDLFGGDCRKISCDLLIDDKACFVFWPFVLAKVLLKEFIEGFKDARKWRRLLLEDAQRAD